MKTVHRVPLLFKSLGKLDMFAKQRHCRAVTGSANRQTGSEIKNAIGRAGYKALEIDTGEQTDLDQLRENSRGCEEVSAFRPLYHSAYVCSHGSHDSFLPAVISRDKNRRISV